MPSSDCYFWLVAVQEKAVIRASCEWLVAYFEQKLLVIILLLCVNLKWWTLDLKVNSW